jgi:serine/threonine protein kinase
MPPYLINLILDAVFLPGYLQLNIDTDVKFKNLNKIHGVGSTGKIVRGRFTSNEFIQKHGDVDLAIKLFYQPKKGDSAEHAQAHDTDYAFEVALMAALPKCVNLVQLLGYSEKPRSIVMKFYPECLENILWSKIKMLSLFPFTPMQVLEIALDIATGLRELHKSSMVHYDLKPCK